MLKAKETYQNFNSRKHFHRQEWNEVVAQAQQSVVVGKSELVEQRVGDKLVFSEWVAVKQQWYLEWSQIEGMVLEFLLELVVELEQMKMMVWLELELGLAVGAAEGMLELGMLKVEVEHNLQNRHHHLNQVLRPSCQQNQVFRLKSHWNQVIRSVRGHLRYFQHRLRHLLVAISL